MYSFIHNVPLQWNMTYQRTPPLNRPLLMNTDTQLYSSVLPLNTAPLISGIPHTLFSLSSPFVSFSSFFSSSYKSSLFLNMPPCSSGPGTSLGAKLVIKSCNYFHSLVIVTHQLLIIITNLPWKWPRRYLSWAYSSYITSPPLLTPRTSLDFSWPCKSGNVGVTLYLFSTLFHRLKV